MKTQKKNEFEEQLTDLLVRMGDLIRGEPVVIIDSGD
jgi:hypothetical protein